MAKKKTYKDSFTLEFNIQNITKPHSKMYYVRYADETSDPLFTVLDWEFTFDQRPDSIGIAEGIDPELNFRRAFLPEEGHLWVSRDFSGQELRIMANLANEPAWIKAFLNGEDIHEATAKAVWGEENYDKDKRKAAKALNFGLLYGMTAVTLAQRLKVTEAEAQKYIDDFFKGLPNILAAQERYALQAQENKELANPYGRKRRMSNFITSYGRITNKGKRRSYNYPIQSMGAEIIKLALIKIYKNILTNPKYEGKVFFMNTIHDEVNLSIDKSVLEEAVKDLGDAMYHRIPGKPVPIITGLEIGNNMGLTWKFKQDLETLKITPEYDPL